jgi:carboxymethylenebutenolidase
MEIRLTVGDRTTRGHLATPAGEGPWPGVVVVQEWWGLNDNIRQVANRFAEAGFVALAPDLYFGETATEPDEARKLVMAMQWDEALDVIQSAINYLVAVPEVSPKIVGTTGFCMGGGLVWHAAAKLTAVGASVPFYGGGPEMTPEEVTQISAPVLGIFGELDRGVTPEVAMARDAMMMSAGIPHETIIYPGAEHAFFNDSRPVYNAEAADDAWRRMIDLFHETLV